MKLDRYKQALSILRNGGIIAYPTDTTYGIGCDAMNLESVNRIFELKGRDYSKPLSLAFGSLRMLQKYVDISDIDPKILLQLFPGPVTLILPKNEIIDDLITSGSKSVGARIPGHPLILELIKELGRPIITTSANISGKADPISANEVELKVDYIIEGECQYKIPSTIIDIHLRQILRAGVNAEYYQKLLSSI